MANININNLSGSDSFNDSESFLIDITDDAEDILGGGIVETIVDASVKLIKILFGSRDLVLGEPVCSSNGKVIPCPM